MLTELVELPGGSFRMGSTQFYPEEAPVHTVTVGAFAVERHPVTNSQFAEFVADTGYVTVAEHAPDPALYPGADPEDLVPGALVFQPTGGPVDLRDWRQWWGWVAGADWRHPFGPQSGIEGRPEHPVVQVAYPDAAAYARWAGRRLPTEAEWEYAARAGATTIYAWGDEAAPDGRLMANTWQGRFPYRNDGALGWVGTSPVATFPPNGFGLVDMIGNVWEWTTTQFSGHHLLDGPVQSCCGPAGAARPATSDPGAAAAATSDPGAAAAATSDPGAARPATSHPGAARPATSDRAPDPSISQTLKGGSHLCAPEYCHRYRPAARSPQSQDTATTHIGFRCVA